MALPLAPNVGTTVAFKWSHEKTYGGGETFNFQLIIEYITFHTFTKLQSS